MLDLPLAHQQILIDIFTQLVPDKQVLAYGSRVKGTAHEGSDLDLVIINSAAPNQPIESIVEIRSAIRESDIPIFVDILDWAVIPESFRRSILENSVLFFGGKAPPTP